MFTWINNFLNGKKTIIGIVSGVGAFLTLLATTLGDGFQAADLQILLTGFSALMVAVGLGHKASKILDFLKK